MSTVFKVVRLVGESPKSIEDAVVVALKASSERVRGQTWAQISDLRANINENGGVDRWQLTVDVAFRVDQDEH
ncbi:MAG: dodecin family protein [Hyphomicrobiaceae bacterium]